MYRNIESILVFKLHYNIKSNEIIFQKYKVLNRYLKYLYLKEI